MDQVENFTVSELAVKCKSKTELYNLLAREGKIYLPPKQDSTQSYLRDIMLGEKLYLNWDQIAVIKVPQYKGLRVNEIIEFASGHIDIKKFLPKYSYEKEPNREWLCNIVNTLLNEEFNKFIGEKVEIRKQEFIKSQNISVSVKPEFLKIFKNSQSISYSKGKSHFLARMPRPTKDQEKIKQLEEEKVDSYYKAKVLKLEIEELKDKMKKLEDEQRDAEDNVEKLSKLYELGIIDENGELINNKME